MSTDLNEPVFVLRAQDLTAPLAIQKWVDANELRLGSLHPKIIEAKTRIIEMQRWPNRKLPD